MLAGSDNRVNQSSTADEHHDGLNGAAVISIVSLINDQNALKSSREKIDRKNSIFNDGIRGAEAEINTLHFFGHYDIIR